MVQSVFGALRVLEDQHAMHCDFKPDQMAFDLHGRAKIVDLDTITHYDKGVNSLFGNRKCAAQNTSELLSHHDHRETSHCCSSCMKHSVPNEHCFCNVTTHRCPGVSSATTLVPVVCEMLMKAFFFNEKHLPASTPDDVKAALQSLSTLCVPEKWGLEQATARLAQMYLKFNGTRCAADNLDVTRSAIESTYIRRRDTSAARCGKSRYC